MYIPKKAKNKEALKTFLLVALLGLSLISGACKPQTASQKVEDKVEDAGHEIEQGVERAKENVK